MEFHVAAGIFHPFTIQYNLQLFDKNFFFKYLVLPNIHRASAHDAMGPIKIHQLPPFSKFLITVGWK